MTSSPTVGVAILIEPRSIGTCRSIVTFASIGIEWHEFHPIIIDAFHVKQCSEFLLVYLNIATLGIA